MRRGLRLRYIASEQELFTRSQGPSPEHRRVLTPREAVSCVRYWLDDDRACADLVRLFHNHGGSFQHGLDTNRRRELVADWLRQQIDFGFLQVAELHPPPPLPPNPAALAAKTAKEDIAPAKEKLGWFEVTVVDAWGKPVGGVDLEIAYEGTRKKVTTPGNGKVKLPEIPASFGSARITNVKDVRDTLRPRWKDKFQPTELPEDVDNPEKLGLDATELLASLESEKPRTIVLVKPLTRVRLIGMHFDTNKCFLRPSAMAGIKQVVSVYKATPTGKLLILGHTDTTADDAYNLDLSVERAEAIKAYLKDDVAAWEAWFGDGKPTQKRWGDVEVTQMIKALPCEPTVHGFQHWSNETRGTDLKVDGVAGPRTRKALIEAYMALDNTTLPAPIGVVTHGCGEFFPRTNEGDEFGKDGVASEQNRRVEMLCFDDEVFPPAPGPKATKGEPQPKEWDKQVTKTIDVANDKKPRVVVRLFDHLGAPVDGIAVKLKPPPDVTVTPEQVLTDKFGFADFFLSKNRDVELEVDIDPLDRQFDGWKLVVRFDHAEVQYYGVEAGLRAFTPKHHYLWQNPTLRAELFPKRNASLRFFLTTYRQIDLELHPSSVNPLIVQQVTEERLAAVIEQQAIVDQLSAKKPTPASLPAAKGELALRKKRLADVEDIHRKAREREPKLYGAELSKLDHLDLMRAVFARFEADTVGQHPKWLRYLIVHFSGLRYKSAHGSFMPPKDFVQRFRSEEDLDRVANLSNGRLADMAREARFTAVQKGWPAETNPQGLADLDAEDLEAQPQKRAELRKKLGKFLEHAVKKGLEGLGDPELLGNLRARAPGWKRAPRYALDEFSWKFVASLTQLRNDANHAPPGEPISVPWNEPTAADYMEALVSQKDPNAAVRAIRAIGGGGTLWKQHHRKTLEPNVSRAVCNQIEEISEHARAVPSSQLSDKGGLTDDAIDFARNGEHGLRQVTGYEVIVDGSTMMWAEWKQLTGKDEWRENKWSTVEPSTPVNGGAGFDRGDGKPIGLTKGPSSGTSKQHKAPGPSDSPPYDFAYTLEDHLGNAKGEESLLPASAPQKWPELVRSVMPLPKGAVSSTTPLPPTDTWPHTPGALVSVLVWKHSAAVVTFSKELDAVITFETTGDHAAGLNVRARKPPFEFARILGEHSELYVGRFAGQKANYSALDTHLDPGRCLAPDLMASIKDSA